MEFLSNNVPNLSSPKAYETCAFLMGFSWQVKIKNKDTLEYPLSSALSGCIAGFFCTIGAAIVYDFVPNTIKPIVPMLCITSAMYAQVKKDEKKDEKNDEKK